MSKLVTVKLEDENYLTWKQQILIASRGYGLEYFIIGGSSIPPQFIDGEAGTQIYNPTVVAYQRQDQLLTSWLLSFISPNLLPHFVGYDSGRGILEAINQLFAS